MYLSILYLFICKYIHSNKLYTEFSYKVRINRANVSLDVVIHIYSLRL